MDKLDIDKLKNIPTNISNLKSKIDELDIDKLVPVPVDLSKLSNVVKNDIIKKHVYNAKIENIDDQIPNITNLATTSALAAVENKIPCVSNLITKTDYNTKINEIEKKITDHDHDKYITTPEFNKLTGDNFAARLKQTNLARKNDIASFLKKTDFNNKLRDNTSNKNELNELSKKS